MLKLTQNILREVIKGEIQQGVLQKEFIKAIKIIWGEYGNNNKIHSDGNKKRRSIHQ